MKAAAPRVLRVLAVPCLVLLALSLAAGCGSGFTLGQGFVVVNGLAPGQSLLCGQASSTVQFVGSGFLSEHGTEVTILWTATEGTPFDGGTSATTETLGTVLSDTMFDAQLPAVFGSIPVTVTVILPGGNQGTSPPLLLEIGGVLVGPFAFSDNYLAVGNVELTVGIENGVLDNDEDSFCSEGELEKPGGPAGPQGASNATVTSFDATSTMGGTVDMNPDGSFSYRPPVGQGLVGGTDAIVQDTFQYTISEPGRPDSTTTVFIELCEVVWFIDSSQATNGNGTSWAPFNSLPAFMARQGGGNADDPAPGHWIHVDLGDGTPYQDGIQLLADQKLVGSGVDLVLCDRLVAPATSAPSLVNSGQAVGENLFPPVIVLGDRNLVTGLQVVGGGGDGIFGAGVTGPTTIDVVNIAEVDGTGINLQGITGDYDIGSASQTIQVGISNVGGHGILIDGVSPPQIALTDALTASGATVDVVATLITGAGSDGIRCTDVDLHVASCAFSDVFTGVVFRTLAFGPTSCSLTIDASTLGVVGQPCAFRGIEIVAGGSSIGAAILGSSATANDEALFATSSSGEPVVMTFDDSVFQTLVTGPTPTINLQGIEGGVEVRRMMDNTIVGNGQGDGFVASSCIFDADPNTAGEQTVAGGNWSIGQGTAAAQRVEGTALQFLGCLGAVGFGTVDVFQAGGDPSCVTNTLPGSMTVTFTALNCDHVP